MAEHVTSSCGRCQNYGYPPDVIEYVKTKTIPHERGRESVVGRTALAAKTVNVADVLADPEYTNLDMQQKLGLRTVLGGSRPSGKVWN